MIHRTICPSVFICVAFVTCRLPAKTKKLGLSPLDRKKVELVAEVGHAVPVPLEPILIGFVRLHSREQEEHEHVASRRDMLRGGGGAG